MSDKELRKKMVALLFGMITEQFPSTSKPVALHISKLVERDMYITAADIEEYIDHTTLETRVRAIAQKLL